MVIVIFIRTGQIGTIDDPAVVCPQERTITVFDAVGNVEQEFCFFGGDLSVLILIPGSEFEFGQRGKLFFEFDCRPFCL